MSEKQEKKIKKQSMEEINMKNTQNISIEQNLKAAAKEVVKLVKDDSQRILAIKILAQLNGLTYDEAEGIIESCYCVLRMQMLKGSVKTAGLADISTELFDQLMDEMEVNKHEENAEKH